MIQKIMDGNDVLYVRNADGSWTNIPDEIVVPDAFIQQYASLRDAIITDLLDD
jgi:hypothetical protein